MTMNKSLRIRKGGGGSRGVLSRAERITKLKELERWEDGQSPLGLPKVRVYKISMKKKKKTKTDETAEDGKKAKKSGRSTGPYLKRSTDPLRQGCCLLT
jgi:small basic protein (TIGR04137 family)